MLLHLAWRRNRDDYDLALAVNRLAAQGVPLWWLGAAGPENEPGDYLCDAPPGIADRIAGFGIVATAWAGTIPNGAVALAAPRIALFAGAAPGDPAIACCLVALFRLGFDVALVDGAAIAAGALRQADLVMLAGGDVLWTLDTAGDAPAADSQLREFLAAGGAAIGSGGGAFHLSAGRPGWSNVAAVRPRFSHEPLLTGAGLVSLRLERDSIGFGCPPTIDAPYGCGPVYDELGRAALAAAVFDRLVLPGGLFGAAPLDAARFAQELAGHAAILRVEGRRGRAVLFSPQLELGDIARKYIAFDGYVPRFLAAHGAAAAAVMLRHYRALDAPVFRLILNAVHSLMLRRASPAGGLPEAAAAGQLPASATHAADIAAVLAAAALPDGDPRAGLAAALRDDLDQRCTVALRDRARLAAGLLGLRGRAPAILAVLDDGEQIADRLLDERSAVLTPPPADRLARAEIALALRESWCRLAAAELHFAGAE